MPGRQAACLGVATLWVWVCTVVVVWVWSIVVVWVWSIEQCSGGVGVGVHCSGGGGVGVEHRAVQWWVWVC